MRFFFFFENIKIITCFFTIWVMFWNISKIYFFFFCLENIESFCEIIILKLFPVIFFWWKIYFFPVMFIYKRFNFFVVCRFFFYFFMASRYCYSVLKALIIFFIYVIYCCFSIETGKSMYDSPGFGFILWHL